MRGGVLRPWALAALWAAAIALTGPATIARADSQTVTALSSSWSANTIAIKPTESVTWSNPGPTVHNLYIDGVQVQASGAPWMVTRAFAAAGQHSYVCMLHPGMNGTLFVNESGTVPGAAPPPGTSPAPRAGGGGAPGVPGAGDTTAPTMRRSGAGGPFCARKGERCRRPGVVLRFSLSEPASVGGFVERTLKGRARRFGELELAGRQGDNNFRLIKTADGKRLVPGRYVATLEAVDAAGNRASPVRFRFRLR